MLNTRSFQAVLELEKPCVVSILKSALGNRPVPSLSNPNFTAQMGPRKTSVGLFDTLMIQATGAPSKLTATSDPTDDKSLLPPTKGKRRHAPKVRTGCRSCKRRRVKCDEGKPHCKRCLTSGTTCDGYAKPEPPKAPRPLLQRELSAVSTPVSPSSTVHCHDEIEYRYFQLYRSEIGPKLGGTFSNKIWDSLMIVASHEHGFVLDGILAISALIESKKATREEFLVVAAEHQSFASKKYQMALQSINSGVNSEKHARRAIIACLLICCFESISGNIFAALSQAQSGHDILQNWLSTHPYPNQTRMGISSPAPQVIEHELVQAAYHFDILLLQHFDTRPVEAHQILKREGSETIERMPHNFSDVEEANVYWQLVQRRALHFVCETTSTASARSSSPYSSAPPPEHYAASGIITPHQHQHQHQHQHLHQHASFINIADITSDISPSVVDPALRYLTPAPSLPDVHSEHQNYSTENLRWRLAFSSLYSRLKKSTNTALKTAANILFIQSLASDIALSTTLPHHDPAVISQAASSRREVSIFDRHMNDFREIVNTSREVVKAKKREVGGSPEFVFEFGITQALYTVARYCPDEALRREVVDVLRWFGCREGAWDSLLLIDMELPVQ